MLILLWDDDAVKFWAVLLLFQMVSTPNMLAVLCTFTWCPYWRTGLSLAWKHCVNLHLTISCSVIILSFGEWTIWVRYEATINGLISERWHFLRQWCRTGPNQKSMILQGWWTLGSKEWLLDPYNSDLVWPVCHKCLFIQFSIWMLGWLKWELCWQTVLHVILSMSMVTVINTSHSPQRMVFWLRFEPRTLHNTSANHKIYSLQYSTFQVFSNSVFTTEGNLNFRWQCYLQTCMPTWTIWKHRGNCWHCELNTMSKSLRPCCSLLVFHWKSWSL